MKAICLRCKTRPRKAHANSKWCHRCAEALKRQPNGTLTASQRAFVVRNSGHLLVREIARRLGTSTANVKRSCRGVRFHAHNGKYKENPDLVKRVLEFYFEHGKSETSKAFPDLSVKSIVDRPEYYGVKRQYRQMRWTDEQIVEAARMAGIISFAAQAKYFNRPNAHNGSIKSLWVKRFGLAGGNIHGMAAFYAKGLVRKRTPHLSTAYWNTRRQDGLSSGRKLCLWVDMERSLRADAPPFVRSAIEQMAEFQRWLFRSKNPKREILRMINEREIK